MYKEKRLPRSEFVPLRGLQYHVQVWGEPAGPANNLPPLVLVHGWMDVAASYQFMVDALSSDFMLGRTIIAPDWRGFGKTSSAHAGARPDSYWFPDYLADLDFLLDHYAGGQPIDLVGHSMGGNIAMVYAGVRPERLRRLVNLEGFGLPASKPAQAPGRYAKWMDELKSLRRGEMSLKSYDSVAGVASRLMKTNPRLSADKADWLANHWAAPDEGGQWHILGEQAHKVTSANLYRADETLQIYRRIAAPVLAVEASDDSLGLWYKGQYTLVEYHERLRLIASCRVAVVADAGHMLHHDQPEALALLLEEFLA
ncbi:MAG: alpha/beta hydrolase [Polaromonas sp.]|jgi:pimeloyl-ACP methyl ester carboxylesterase|nr:alpha/beta hydrolase [Polaromonas sp.]